MKTPHKHAEVLRAIADGGDGEYQLTDKSWRPGNENFNPINYPHLNWRIKPKMVRVGRHSWPMPLSEAPARDTTYFTLSAGVLETHWCGNLMDCHRLEQGLCHLTKEAAEHHAAALRCINLGDIE